MQVKSGFVRWLSTLDSVFLLWCVCAVSILFQHCFKVILRSTVLSRHQSSAIYLSQ